MSALKHTSYSIFQEHWWLDIVAPGDWEEAVVSNGTTILARLPYVRNRRTWLHSLSRPKLTARLGPWFAATDAKNSTALRRQKDYVEGLLSQLPNVAHASIVCHPEVTNVLPFYWAGYDLRVRYTYRLDSINDLESVWNGLSTNIRGDIRKADKVVQIEYDLGVNKFFSVFEKTFARQNRNVPFSRGFLERLDKALEGRNCRRQLFAVDSKGGIHAAIYIVWDDRCAYYLLGAGDPALRSSGANSLLLWHAIQLLSKHTRVFDFEGSMIEPIERFFRAFGAIQTPYYHLTKISNPVLRAVKALRNVQA